MKKMRYIKIRTNIFKNRLQKSKFAIIIVIVVLSYADKLMKKIMIEIFTNKIIG
jgi:hypothetical protein